MYGVGHNITIRPIVRFPYAKFILNSLGMFCYLLRDDNPVVFTRSCYFAYLASFLDKTVVLETHQHAFVPAYHNHFNESILKRLQNRDNTVFVVISQKLREIFQRKGVVAPMLVCHDGYDERSAVVTGEPRINRAGYRAAAVYAGSLTKMKGLGHIERLASRHTDVMFCLLGDDEARADGEIVARMRRMPNVVFTGLGPHTEIHAYLSEADVLLLLPTKDGLYNDVTSPLKMFEYMNTGRAILSTAMPSISEVLKDGRNCLMAEDDPEDIDRKFSALLDDGELRRELGLAAVDDVKEYSWTRRSARIMEFVAERTARAAEAEAA